ncbi:MAG: hypothetical protein ACE5EV_04640 [Gaiellales bacterium]
MRFRSWGGIGGFLVLLASFGLAACGGSEVGAQAPDGDGRQDVAVSWVDSANDLCREGRDAIEEAVGSPAAISGADGTDPIATQRAINRIGIAVVSQLRALPLPAGNERRASELIDRFEETNEINAATLDAAMRDDVSALDALIDEFTRASARFHDVALELDVTECIRQPFQPEPGPKL